VPLLEKPGWRAQTLTRNRDGKELCVGLCGVWLLDYAAFGDYGFRSRVVSIIRDKVGSTVSVISGATKGHSHAEFSMGEIRESMSHNVPQNLFENAIAPQDAPVPMPKAMLVFAHPDDEVIALGARLGRFQSAVFVHVTDGAPRNGQDSRAYGFASFKEYRQQREQELTSALLTAGLQHASRIWLEIPDQEASLQLPQFVNRISQLLMEWRPEVVFTHPYEGGHPDHDACAFAVHRAAARFGAKQRTTPLIVEGTFYHATAQGSETGCFLPHPDKTREVVFELSPEEQLRKKALLACFTTQKETLRGFSLESERFRIAPQYDFRHPPYCERVSYEQYPWGMTSQHFCQLAQQVEIEDETINACD
jgi:LmbE family N-acetylglucosaminyl deacetylase